MKIRILQLLLIGSMLLTACGKTTPVTKQRSITKNEVSIPEQKPITEKKVDTTEKKNNQDVKTPVDKKTGIKLNEVSAVDLSKYTKNEELSLFKSPTATFILTTDSVLTDFKIQNIEYDGIKCEVNEDLYSKKTFDINMSLKVKAYIPETFSNLLISYNKDGNLYRYYVNSNMSGEGADACLQPVKTALEAKSTDKVESNIDKSDKTERIFKIVTKNVDYKVISGKEIKTVGLGVSDNIKKILSTISTKYFDGKTLELKAIETVNNKKIAVINLGGDKSYWNQRMQGSVGGEITEYTLIENILQREYKGYWIDGVKFTIDGKHFEATQHSSDLAKTIYK